MVGPGQWRRLLAAPANNHCDLLIAFGWGDGTLHELIRNDPLLRQKFLVLFVFPGEWAHFAASLERLEPAEVARENHRIHLVADLDDLVTLVQFHFNAHSDVALLGGVDLITNHPLGQTAEAERAAWMPRTLQVLTDRPQVLGNDIEDSWCGLKNATRNAPLLLPAPTLARVAAANGAVPVIAVAAGPSLADHLDRLRELQHHCLIVACDAVLSGLLDAGIDPHVFVSLERTPRTARLTVRAGESRTVYAGLPVCPHEGVARFGPHRCLGVFAADDLYPWLAPDIDDRINAGSSSGVLSTTVAGRLSSGPVYLVGHDLAHGGDETHWSGAPAVAETMAAALAGDGHANQRRPGFEERWLDGNSGQPVRSLVNWDRFRVQISHQAFLLRQAGRDTINVNATRAVGAVIPHTVAGELPTPASLDRLAGLALPPAEPERLTSFRQRAARLAEDAAAFIRYLHGFRQELTNKCSGPVDRWPVDRLAKRLTMAEAVSPGNRLAFAYFLRSAWHNTNADMHYRRDTESYGRSRWATVSAMDSLATTLTDALDHLMPEIQEVSRDIAG